MSYISVTDIQKSYHVGESAIHALKDVSFSICKGEFVVILGPSGSGKTTLLNILGGMDSPTKGSFTLENKEIHQLGERELVFFRRHEVGFIFQFYNLIPTLTALENVKVAQRIGRQSFEAEDILKRVAMSHRLKNFPQELSGGEQQRVSIARAICKNPRLILCDEPTGALDSETGKQVLSLLKEMSEEHQHTILLVTHNSKIAAIADRVIHLKDGKIIKNEQQHLPLTVQEVAW